MNMNIDLVFFPFIYFYFEKEFKVSRTGLELTIAKGDLELPVLLLCFSFPGSGTCEEPSFFF